MYLELRHLQHYVLSGHVISGSGIESFVEISSVDLPSSRERRNGSSGIIRPALDLVQRTAEGRVQSSSCTVSSDTRRVTGSIKIAWRSARKRYKAQSECAGTLKFLA